MPADRRTFRVRLTTRAKQRLRRARRVQVSVRATWTGVTPTLRKTKSVRLTR